MSQTHPGVERTLRTLLRSPNTAATDLLVEALGSGCEAMRVGAVRALALRDDPEGHTALVDRLASLEDRERAALADVEHRAPLAGSLPRLLKSGDPKRSRNAAQAAVAWRAVGVLPAMVEAAQQPDTELGREIAAGVLLLALDLERLLIEEETRAPQAPRPQGEDDPAFARRDAVAALSRSLSRFGEHGQEDLVEAILLLAPYDDPGLRQALLQPTHPAHEVLREALGRGESHGAIAILAGLLSDPSTPQSLLELVASRDQPGVVSSLLERIGSPIGVRARQNAERIDSFAWFRPHQLENLVSMPGKAQAAALQLVAASQASRRTLAEAIGLLVDKGDSFGALAACRLIERLPNHLALEPLAIAVESIDPAVAATAARLLRKKDFPQATNKLVGMLESDRPEIREAAQRALHEVSFSSFRDNYLRMPPHEQRTLGAVVAKADPMAVESLGVELRSGATSRRMLALELIDVMRLAEPLKDQLVAALGDNDAGVRTEAARALGEVTPTPPLREALIDIARRDPSSAVRSAAEASLVRIDALGGAAPAQS